MTENTTSPEASKEDQHHRNKGTYIINIILFLGLLVLYILFFLSRSDNETKGEQSYSKHQINTTTSNIIAFVNTDEIMDNYELVMTMKKTLNEKMGRMEQEIITK